MEICDDIEHFKKVAHRKKAVRVAPYLFDEMKRIIDWRAASADTFRLLNLSSLSFRLFVETGESGD
jgi:hypothetical protein